MAYDIEGNEIKAKRTGEMITVDNKNPHWAAALKYNHVRVEFTDGVETSLLFTDNQVKKAIKRAENNEEDLPKKGWMTSIIESVVKTDLADIQMVKNTEKNNREADCYNHILIEFNGKLYNMLFTNNEILVAIKRAKRNPEDIPKVSWIKDILD